MSTLAAGVAACGVLAQSPASAADLGGSCCADLEERIAELEATTARKGNRKVSLTVSGWVHEAVFLWDDGTERNAYIGTNQVEQSRFKFTGEAKIAKGWSAGYEIEVGVAGHPSSGWSQLSEGDNFTFTLRKSNWFVKSEHLGKLAVGLNATATYHLLDDANFTLTRSFNDAESPAVYLSQFFLRANGQFIGTAPAGSPLRWTDALRGFNNSTPGQDGRRDVIRYDTPTIAGFSVAAAWGEDDLADVALIYKGEIHDFKVAARAGYGNSTDGLSTGTACLPATPIGASDFEFDCKWGGAAATVQHTPTGLYLFGGWGRQHVDNDRDYTPGTVFLTNSDTWFLQPGIEYKWLPLGKTAIYGQYRHDDAGSNPGITVATDATHWQGGIVQEIENASMIIYALYQHSDGELTGNAVTAAAGRAPDGVTKLDAFQEVIMGAKINF